MPRCHSSPVKCWYVAFALLMVFNSFSDIVALDSPTPEAAVSRKSILDSIGTEYKYTVIIDPANDKAVDSEICHPPNSGGKSKFPCKTLYYAFQHFHQFNSVKFYLASPKSTYELNVTVNFTNSDKIGIFGNNTLHPSLSPEVECKPQVGLSFVNTNNIKFDSTDFTKCGARQISTSKDLSDQMTSRMLLINVSLYFNNCTNVSMYQVQVKNGSNAIGVVMYDVDGTVNVSRCNFTANRATPDNKCDPLYHGGGGFSVEFTSCRLVEEKCLSDDNQHANGRRRNRNATYLFLNSSFLHNFACGQNVSNNGRWTLSSGSFHQAVGRGGGLSLFLKGDARNNSIYFVNCNFSSNHAVWGGGLLLEMSDSAVNNTINISRCSFIHNHAFFEVRVGTGGGGIFISTSTYFWSNPPRDTNTLNSQIHLENCTFTRNEAIQGGAVSFELGRHEQCCPVQVQVSSSLFQENKAQLGSAVSVKRVPAIRKGYDPHISFDNCSFVNNAIKYHNNSVHTVGIGTIYVNQIPVDFYNQINFANNSGSAVGVVGAQVNFTGTNAHFFNNSGLVGAGIALLGVASIVVGNTTIMNFTNNYAVQYGGAIYNNYIIREDLWSDNDCFIHYSQPFIHPRNWSTLFLFLNNTADRHGKSIFSSSVLPCSHGYSKPKDIFCWSKEYWNYGNSNCTDEIFTRPHSFSMNNMSLNTSISTYPGFQFQLPLTAWDDLDHNVTNDSVYYAYRYDSKSSLRVQNPFKHVSYNYIGLNGQPGENSTLIMQTVFSQKMHVNITVSMKDCPPGFDQTNQTDNRNEVIYTCKCSETHTFGNSITCYSKELRSYIRADKWLGQLPERGNELYMSQIPHQYREPSNGSDKILLPLDRRKLDQILCGGVNRTSQLCGECVTGYAVSVNSPDYRCVPCSKTDLPTTKFVRNLFAYIALTYGPIFILFLAIIVLNFKLTSSAAMGFVLYAQMVGSEVFSLIPGALVTNPHYNKTNLAYSAIYGIFNLNSLAFLMDPFCLNKHFNTLDVICLDYAIAAFPLAMIILIYLVIQCTSRFKCPKRSPRPNMVNITSDPSSSASRRSIVMKERKRAPRNTLVHAFSAFMFLSYTKFCLASMKTISMKEVYTSDERYIDRRIALAGQWRFTSNKFLYPYGIMAIFVLIFAVLLPPFLLLGPIQMIDWLIEKPRFQFLSKIWPSITFHTFLDTFQGFYKPGRRFFGGVFVLFRLVVFISYSFSVNVNQHYAIQQVAVVVLICLLAIFRPYTNELHNQVNILIFLNLSILNTFAVFMYTDSAMHFSSKIYTVQCILVWLPLLYIICYAIWSRLNQRESYHKVKDKVQQKLRFNMVSPLSPKSDQESSNLLEEIPVDEDEDIFQRATTKNRYRPPSRAQSSSNDVTFSEVSGPYQPEVKLQEDVSTGDSGAGTGTGTGGSSGNDMKCTF